MRREVVGALAVEAFEIEDGLTPADRVAVALEARAGVVVPFRRPALRSEP